MDEISLKSDLHKSIIWQWKAFPAQGSTLLFFSFMLTLSQFEVTGLRSWALAITLKGCRLKQESSVPLQSVLGPLRTWSPQHRHTHLLLSSETSHHLHSSPHFLRISLLSVSRNLKAACSQANKLVSPKLPGTLGLGLVFHCLHSCKPEHHEWKISTDKRTVQQQS